MSSRTAFTGHSAVGDAGRHGRSAFFLERARPPDETVALIRAHFDELGITRLADQTDLDRVGMPCFAAFRPNAATLANNQGKGITPADAKASAVMEATEFSIAEDPPVERFRGSIAEMQASGFQVLDIRRWLPLGEELAKLRAIAWVRGNNLLSPQTVLVPFAIITIDHKKSDIPRLHQSTNGLASGNTESEAVFHALCELIERDADTLWSLLPLERRLATAFHPCEVDDETVDMLVERIEAAGLSVRLFDQTSDIGVPSVMALIGKADDAFAVETDLAAGYGTHPVLARACMRALTEAAQTRVTTIAGSRDDFDPAQYGSDAHEDGMRLLRAAEGPLATTSPVRAGAPLEAMLDCVMEQLCSAGIDMVIKVLLGGERLGVSVVKLISPQLEDRRANRNWRPGPRALKVVCAQS